ncbi:Uma2 family endonuclease [Paracidobacterium acidisoli]|uniref:Uma2 family endonuclease n=1 Tax=Paracidobacterium acidisoli TaxID=2303751 RepID=A0A372IL75_9BACT|nr:Uma2 family endonuclease [Paracidobacterium acidisoli]MBT9332275.1 Uma2 family endonuclease [Paracidobacterium acidisoli]
MATATPLPISVSEYLHTSYRPDCDYVDGIIEERNLGELDHAAMQGALMQWFSQHAREWGIHVYPEIRVQVSSTRFRIADICLVSRQAPREQIIQTPPVAVIEILSPEDRRPRYAQRLDDYRHMGVKHIWVIDPATRKGFDCSSRDWIETSHFVVSGSPVHLDLAALFAAIDEDHAR